jgi:hypothetical protein
VLVAVVDRVVVATAEEEEEEDIFAFLCPAARGKAVDERVFVFFTPLVSACSSFLFLFRSLLVLLFLTPFVAAAASDCLRFCGVEAGLVPAAGLGAAAFSSESFCCSFFQLLDSAAMFTAIVCAVC